MCASPRHVPELPTEPLLHIAVLAAADEDTARTLVKVNSLLGNRIAPRFLQARSVRRQMVHLFECDPLSLVALRCLVLIGRNENVLGTWSAAVVRRGTGACLKVCGTYPPLIMTR